VMWLIWNYFSIYLRLHHCLGPWRAHLTSDSLCHGWAASFSRWARIGKS
jgi:hypothetical protein